MTYFISAMHNGMTIRTELANEAEIDNVIAFLAKNPDFVWTVMYTKIDGVPVSFNLAELYDDFVVEYAGRSTHDDSEDEDMEDNVEENKGEDKVEEKKEDDNLDDEHINLFDFSDDDIFKGVIDTSEEDTDDDTDEGFLKYIEEKKFLY